MASTLLTVVETAAYMRDAIKLMSDEQRSGVVDLVATNPECGDLIQGSGGMRKVRVALDGRGKRGGARVIYFFHNGRLPAFLMAVFAKNERADLSAAEIAALARIGKQIVKEYGAKDGKESIRQDHRRRK